MRPSNSSQRPNPYRTLPAKTISYIQLRFQLNNFENVYRIVQLPITFTFANLHTFIQYIFGWSNSHMHRAEVVSYVVMQDGERAGMMKRWGRKPTFFREYLRGEEERYGDRISYKFESDDNPIYCVEQCGQSTELRMNYAKIVKDSDLTLGDIWNKDPENNAARGECPNDELGVIYEYDLGDSWVVHISCLADQLFFELETPLNLPIIEQADGAPPIEHAPEWVPGEEEANDKTVPDCLFVGENFELYCEGKLMSCARKKELAIYTDEEEKERLERLQIARQERMESAMDVDEEGNEFDDQFLDEDDDDELEYY